MLMQKTRGMGEGQFRLVQPDAAILASVREAQAKRLKKKENGNDRPIKMGKKRHTPSGEAAK